MLLQPRIAERLRMIDRNAPMIAVGNDRCKLVKRITIAVSFAISLAGAYPALAQQSAVNPPSLVDSDYPQPQGRVQPIRFENFPKWASVDFQIRVRGESQSSDKYIAGNDAIYALTRVWGGLELRPDRHVTAYIQFVDAHALGLPLTYVAANMRDAFDGRQAFVDLHAGRFKLIAGRQASATGPTPAAHGTDSSAASATRTASTCSVLL